MKIKRLLALALSLMMALSMLSGCGSRQKENGAASETESQTESTKEEESTQNNESSDNGGSAQAGESSQAEDRAGTEESSEEEAKTPELPAELFENEYASVTVTNYTVGDGFLLEMEVTNVSGFDMEVSFDHETVNGMRVSTEWAEQIAADETKNFQIRFPETMLEEQHVDPEDVHTVCFKFVGRWEKEGGGEASFVEECEYFPFGQEAVKEPETYLPGDADIALLDAGDYALYVLGTRWEDGAFVLDCYAQNDRSDLTAIWIGYALINDEFFEDAVVFRLPSGARQYGEIRFEPYMLADYGITEVYDLILGLSVRDQDNNRLEDKEVTVIREY